MALRTVVSMTYNLRDNLVNDVRDEERAEMET